MRGGYRHLYVVVEQVDGKLVPVSLEMLGEARRLVDKFNKRYRSKEKVVAVLLGHQIRDLAKTLIAHGADAVVCADHPELKEIRNNIYTKVISQIATDKKIAAKLGTAAKGFKKPRYMFFAADSIGRHLSSTVLAQLESGLASDINKLEISDISLVHQHKTGGKKILFKKTLEMYRPDFSGFLWTTILCLDNKNPNTEREYHPQACSIIPGVFEPISPKPRRKGVVIDYQPIIDPEDLAVKIQSKRIVKRGIDFESRKAIVAFGRGIKDSPDHNIALVESLADVLEAEIGVSLPLSKKPFSVSRALSDKYMIPERVIGSSGSTVSPLVYVAVGISGAVQHVTGMKDSELVVAINPDENAAILNESDIFIKGRMEEVIPLLVEELKRLKAGGEVKVK